MWTDLNKGECLMPAYDIAPLVAFRESLLSPGGSFDVANRRALQIFDTRITNIQRRTEAGASAAEIQRLEDEAKSELQSALGLQD
jgi:hypothetical protein